MLMVPIGATPVGAVRMLGLAALLSPSVCLDPAMLRSMLVTLEMQLRSTADTLQTQEMGLLQHAGVRLERFLLPFLRDAETFFSYALRRVPELQQLVQTSLRLIGSGQPMTFISVYECRDAERIRNNLRRIDQSLTTLNQALRQMEAAYRTDADRISQIIQRQINAPVMPEQISEVPAPQRPRMQSVAEQMALAAVARFRRDVAAAQMLLGAAFMEIVASVALRPVGNLPVRMLPQP
jgi:hypothetical protein